GQEVGEKLRKRLRARSEKDRVGVRRGLVGQRCHVQAAEDDKDAFGAIGVGQGVCALRVGDVDLNRHQVRLIVGRQRRDVLVFDRRLVVRPQVGGERRQAERRKERGLHGPPGRAGGLGQGGQDG